jgi:hypothetical protein
MVYKVYEQNLVLKNLQKVTNNHWMIGKATEDILQKKKKKRVNTKIGMYRLQRKGTRHERVAGMEQV